MIMIMCVEILIVMCNMKILLLLLILTDWNDDYYYCVLFNGPVVMKWRMWKEKLYY
jgi:hypothetical protein